MENVVKTTRRSHLHNSKLRQQHRLGMMAIVADLLLMQWTQIHHSAMFDKHVKKTLVFFAPINHGA